MQDGNKVNSFVMSAHEGCQARKESSGKLKWGRMLDRRSYTLCEGSTVIGREDRRTPSDLQISDPEVSRRSVRIDVIPDGAGSYVFTLIVMKALNPVMVNGKAVDEGMNIKLSNGDHIILGRTTLNFRTFR